MRMEWRADAACKHLDPELFFPIAVGAAAAGQVQQAKAVCRGCPVVAACLDWATAHGPVAGIWGGSTELERDRTRRRHLGTATIAAGPVSRSRTSRPPQPAVS